MEWKYLICYIGMSEIGHCPVGSDKKRHFGAGKFLCVYVGECECVWVGCTFRMRRGGGLGWMGFCFVFVFLRKGMGRRVERRGS